MYIHIYIYIYIHYDYIYISIHKWLYMYNIYTHVYVNVYIYMYIHYDWIPIMGSMTTKCMPSHTMSRPLAHIIGWETSKRDGRFHVSDLVWHRKLRVESMKKGVIKLFSRYVCVWLCNIMCTLTKSYMFRVFFCTNICTYRRLLLACTWRPNSRHTA